MSSSVFVEFYLKKSGRKLKEVVNDYLKYKMEGHVCGSEANRPLVDVGEVGVDYEQSYIGYMPKDTVFDNADVESRGAGVIQLNKNADDKYSDKVVEIPISDLMNKRAELADEYIEVHGYRRYQYHGEWYDYASFEAAFCRAEKERDELGKQIHELERLETTVDYFKLDSGEKEDYHDKIAAMREELEDINYRIYAYQNMMFLLSDFLKDLYDVNGDEVVAYIYLA